MLSYEFATHRVDYRYEGGAENLVYVVNLGGFEGMAFVGYRLREPAGMSSINSVSSLNSESVQTNFIACVPEEYELDDGSAAVDYDNQKCTLTFDDVELKVTILGFGQSTQWGASVVEVVSWLEPAWKEMSALGMTPSKGITLSIEQLPGTTRGKVTSTGVYWERCKTLHLTNDQTESKTQMKHTIAHEYFHNGQCNPSILGADADGLFGISRDNKVTHWIKEGTARWFEDHVFDGENQYRTTPVPGHSYVIPRITQAGISVEHIGTERTSGYNRPIFFKMLESKCPNYSENFSELITTDHFDYDGSYTSSLIDFLDKYCDFGDHLWGAGYNYRSLASALTFYQYATLYDGGDMRRVQFDEGYNASDFEGLNEDYKFKKEGKNEWLADTFSWTNRVSQIPYVSTNTKSLSHIRSIPPAGAISLTVPEMPGSLLETHKAQLTIKVTNGEDIVVSIMGVDTENVAVDTQNFESHSGRNMDGNQHFSYTTFDTITSYRYGGSTGVPGLFVTLVNPSLEDDAVVEVGFNVVFVGCPDTRIYAQGKEWMQPCLFNGLSWSEVNAVCPGGTCLPGETLNGQDMTGWTWASITDLLGLINYYGVEPPVSLTNIPVYDEGSTWAPSFFADGFHPTELCSNNDSAADYPCYSQYKTVNALVSDECVVARISDRINSESSDYINYWLSCGGSDVSGVAFYR